MKIDRKNITVAFIALGCPKNVVDAERMLAEIAQAGFMIVADITDSDVVVINTCGFIAPAKDEAIETIRECLACKGKTRLKKVIVAGCLAERLKEELADEVTGIDAVVGLAQRDNIVNIIGESLESNTTQFHFGRSETFVDDRTRLLLTPSHYAYLRIAEGCDRSCSFCTIPFIRGPYRSKPMDLILDEARQLVDFGTVELNLIAQDTTVYGRDLGIDNGLAKLLVELEKIKKLRWIRILYAYPTAINDELIAVIGRSRKVLHYLDLPLQHIDDTILKHMHRPDTEQSIRGLITKLRQAVVDIVLRTTLIVGFPGEMDEQFQTLLDFVRWAQFDCLGCFPYYPEEGTQAARLAGQLSEEVKQQRREELMLCQQQITFEKNRARNGQQFKCLVDSVSKRHGRGRFYGQAPEIDSICYIEKCRARAGQVVEVKVVDVKDYDLIVEQI